MSNGRKSAEAEGPMLDEPGPISFGAGMGPRVDEPAPIRFGGDGTLVPKPPHGDLSDFDFATGPKIALPDYITRAAQRWNPDAGAPTAKAPPAPPPVREPEPAPAPPAFAPPPAFSAPADEPNYQEPLIEPEPSAAIVPPQDTFIRAPRRPVVPRPEPTYAAQIRPPPAPEPKRYFTPLPEPEPPPPRLAPEPAPQEAPLIQIQIRRLPPLFKGSGLMRGLFFGCALGVAVGGIAAVMIDLFSPKPEAPVVLPRVISAPAVGVDADAAPTAVKPKPAARRGPAKGYAKPDDKLDLDRLQSTIRVQTAPPPRAVLRQGPSTPIEPERR
ncbi:MAG TPA: hypothetical protein VFN88_06485 [Caulobacteraceae bacterium]|nr:hypothetical protein [Caulobacteraceae bacterium]